MPSASKPIELPAARPSVADYYESFHRARGKVGTVDLPERLQFLKRETGTGKRVVELGCRYGAVLEQVRDGNDIHGVDVDRAALRICAERLGIAPQYANLNEPLPFADAAFDVVIMTEVLEHLPYPSLTLGEIARILRPGGKLVGSVPNATRLRNRLRFLVSGRVETDPTHLFHYGERSLAALLGDRFESVRTRLIAGRLVGLSRRLFANYILFAAERPRRPAPA